jgi:hypothetical protein
MAAAATIFKKTVCRPNYIKFSFAFFCRNMSSSKLAVGPPQVLKQPIHVPVKIMMGPGPSNVSDRVLQAQALPTIGHLHPEYCKVLFKELF